METTCGGSSMSREAMKLALDMLNEIADDVYCDQKLEGVITVLRQALETEQEPVAWLHNFIEGNVITHIPADIGRHPERWIPLYASPCQTCQSLAMAVVNDQTYHEKVIPKREWVGLTDDEVAQAMYRADAIITGPMQFKFAKEIEAKIKEKNHG